MAAKIVLAAAAACATATPAASYDFFLLELQWGITLCSDGTFSCTTTAQWFTLHGLWPENTDGSYPSNCGGASFNASAVADIVPDLNKYWPSLNGPNAAFWAHEWTAHGTCATDVFDSQHAFFNGTLAARSRYDIVAALASAGITPSNTKGFTKAAFGAALTAAYGQTAIINCDANGWISTAVQCIAKDMTIMACPPSVRSKCTPTTVYLPARMAA